MTIILYASQLREIAPECTKPEGVTAALQRAMNKYEISANTDRVAAFLAHTAVESAGFTRVRENLFYTQPERLRAVWPHRFPTTESAIPYTRNAELLANLVYANRLGNGGPDSGDGYRFRGGGYIQTTGKENYSILEKALLIPFSTKPELIEDPINAALSAAFFWNTHGLNNLADAIPGVSEDKDFLQETHIINGGETGLKDRQRRFEIAKQVLG